MVKPISPYLLRPLRSLEEVLRELDPGVPEPDTAPPAEPAPGGPGNPAKPVNPQDSVTIGGVDVPVTPGEPASPPTGGQLDIKA